MDLELLPFQAIAIDVDHIFLAVMISLSEKDPHVSAAVDNDDSMLPSEAIETLVEESHWTRFKRGLNKTCVEINLTLPRPRWPLRRSNAFGSTDSSYAAASRDVDPDTFTKKIKMSYGAVALTWLLYLFLGLGLVGMDRINPPSSQAPSNASSWWTAKQGGTQCPAQPKPLSRGEEWKVEDDYEDMIAERLSKAVQIPVSRDWRHSSDYRSRPGSLWQAVSYDKMGPIGTDPAWKPHADFAAFLERTYPSVYRTLTHEFVNTHGHLFTWTGSRSVDELKPVLLMAHEDVVPVNEATLGQWTHPPFDGVIADGWVWGRGAADCKNQLLGIMNAIEKLVDQGFQPERTILIQFGFDEEIGGPRGAQEIAKVIEERYGADSIAWLVDEGFGGVDDAYGQTFASLGMAEKGTINLQIDVE